jgi:hypothetical protein
MFGNMDPFVEIIALGRNQIYKTGTIDEGGKNPVWNK